MQKNKNISLPYIAIIVIKSSIGNRKEPWTPDLTIPLRMTHSQPFFICNENYPQQLVFSEAHHQ